MKSMGKISGLIFVVAAQAYGFQWPVEDLAVTATFGENRWNHFHGGIDIGGGEQDIYPIDDGEVIFYFQENSNGPAVPTGLGNFIVVEHAQGIRSLYAHLKPDTVDPEQVVVTTSDSVGVTGETGSSLGRHLHFEVSDREFRQMVNPLRLLPELADFSPPTIGGVLLTATEDDTVKSDRRLEIGSTEPISPGSWNVLVETYDVSEYVGYFCPMAPYQVQIYLNGQKTLSIVFDAIEEKGDKLGLIHMPDSSFERFYVDDWLIDVGPVSIPEGEVKLEVVVSDYAGNEVSKMYALTAGRPAGQ